MRHKDFRMCFESLQRVHDARLREWKARKAKISWLQKLIRWKKIFIEIISHICFYFKVFPLILAIAKKYYWNSTNISKDVVYGKEQHQKLDIYSPKQQTNEILIFCYGGAWGSGDKMFYSLIGDSFSKQGFTVIIPNYKTYPKGKIEDMVTDFDDLLHWIDKTGDKNKKLHVVAHSAGAHIFMTLLIRLKMFGSHGDESFQKTFFQRFRSNINITNFVALAGVYDIYEHYLFETRRAVEKISPMHNALHGIENFHLHSPTQLVKHFAVSLDPKIFIIHGRKDTTVPVSSSRLFYEEATFHGADRMLFIENDMDHTAVIFDLMKQSSFLDQVINYFNYFEKKTE